MTLEQQIIFLVISQFVLLGALIVSNFLNRRHTTTLLRDEIKVKKHLEYIEKQLSELYGPISSILQAQGVLIRTRIDPHTGTRTDMPNELWQSLRDEVMIPNAKQIAEIIEQNYHLIEGNEMSQSYRDYIVHAQMWPLRIKLNIKSNDFPEKFRFPKEFQTDIYETTNRLKKEYYSLIDHEDKPE